MFNFNEMITPKIIGGLYALSAVLLVGLAIYSGMNGEMYGLVLSVVFLAFLRVFFESIMVVFKNNEYLKRIANALDGGRMEKKDIQPDSALRETMERYEGMNREAEKNSPWNKL